MTHPLRVAVFEAGYMITRGYRVLGAVSGIRGFASDRLQENMRATYPNFNISYVWTEDRWELAGHLVNGSYTGIMGLMDRNKSDMSFVPLPSLAEASPVVEFGPVLRSFATSFATTLQVGTYEANVLNQLFRFSNWTILFTALAIIAFGLTLSACEKSGDGNNSLTQSAWKMMEMLLNQAQADPASQAGKILVALTVIAVFFWLQLWQSQMTTELCGYDTSNVVQTFEDVIRLNRTPLLIAQEPSTILFEQEAKLKPDSVFGELYRRSEVADLTRESNELGNMFRYDVVEKFMNSDKLKTLAPISSRIMTSIFRGLSCSWSEFDYLLGKDQVLEAPQTYWFSKFLDQKTREILYHRQVLLRESGIALQLYKDLFEMVPELTKETIGKIRTNCVFDSLEQYLTKLQQDTPITIYLRFWQIKSVFLLMYYLFLTSMIILLIELMLPSKSSSLKYMAPNNLCISFYALVLLLKWKKRKHSCKVTIEVHDVDEIIEHI